MRPPVKFVKEIVGQKNFWYMVSGGLGNFSEIAYRTVTANGLDIPGFGRSGLKNIWPCHLQRITKHLFLKLRHGLPFVFREYLGNNLSRILVDKILSSFCKFWATSQLLKTICFWFELLCTCLNLKENTSLETVIPVTVVAFTGEQAYKSRFYTDLNLLIWTRGERGSEYRSRHQQKFVNFNKNRSRSGAEMINNRRRNRIRSSAGFTETGVRVENFQKKRSWVRSLFFTNPKSVLVFTAHLTSVSTVCENPLNFVNLVIRLSNRSQTQNCKVR